MPKSAPESHGIGLSQPPFNPLPGTPYSVVGRVGAGTSSEVFEVLDRRGRRRAVKVLRTVLADDPHAVFRLKRVAYLLAGLRHPNIVPVVDVGTTSDGRPFLVMPLLLGRSARERLVAEGPMASRVACAVAIDMLAGLDAAHAAGIVHRDIKPANLFLPVPCARRPLRRCVVLDFGIAKVEASPTGPQTESRILGTPRYLSPEQVLAGPIDPRTDVYAAGLTLFELVAGRSPFQGLGTVDLLHAHVELSPPDLREFADVSSELAHAVERAVAKSPARRWPSARAFAAVLERAACCESIHHKRIRGDSPPSGRPSNPASLARTRPRPGASKFEAAQRAV